MTWHFEEIYSQAVYCTGLWPNNGYSVRADKIYLFLLTNDRNTWLTTLISTFQRISSCFNSTNKSKLTPSLVFLASRSAVQVTVMLDHHIVPPSSVLVLLSSKFHHVRRTLFAIPFTLHVRFALDILTSPYRSFAASSAAIPVRVLWKYFHKFPRIIIKTCGLFTHVTVLSIRLYSTIYEDKKK